VGWLWRDCQPSPRRGRGTGDDRLGDGFDGVGFSGRLSKIANPAGCGAGLVRQADAVCLLLDQTRGSNCLEPTIRIWINCNEVRAKAKGRFEKRQATDGAHLFPMPTGVTSPCARSSVGDISPTHSPNCADTTLSGFLVLGGLRAIRKLPAKEGVMSEGRCYCSYAITPQKYWWVRPSFPATLWRPRDPVS